ncbi:SGNH/GDSL hydrolase family protein [Parasphingorhabdus pacifica]
MRHFRQAACAIAAAVVSLGVVAVPAFGAEAATNYVALGDSYASGTGTREYFEDSGDCYRSPHAYAQLWADSHDVADFAFDACSGAVTGDVLANQLDSLSEDTSLVTISIGGNDIGFASVIQDCLLGTNEMCDAAVSEGEAKARDELPAKLDETYAAIANAAPSAEVIVVGYPQINEPTGSCGIPGFTEAKRQRINAGGDVLAGVISERAAAAGFTFADARTAFEGHGVCSDAEWINGPSNPLRESFHPNVDGHAEGYLPVVNAVTA